MLFKDISYLELWQPLCSVDWNHLCNIWRIHHAKLFCKIILNLDQWFRRKSGLKVFLIWSLSGSPCVQRSINMCAIFVRGIKRNKFVKLFWIWVIGSGGDAFKDISYLELWYSLCSIYWNHLCNIGSRHHEEEPYVVLRYFLSGALVSLLFSGA